MMLKLILGFTAANFVLLLLIIKKQNKMEQVSEQQFNTLLDSIDSETTRIGTDLLDIKDQIKKYGLPAEAETNIFARLEKHAAALKAMGSSNASPVAEGSPVSEGSPSTDGSVSPSTDIV
jgi:hypothetical protein